MIFFGVVFVLYFLKLSGIFGLYIYIYILYTKKICIFIHIYFICMNIYTVVYIRCTTSEGGTGGRSPLPYLKNKKKTTLILEKRALFGCIYGLNFHLKCSFQSILETKNLNFCLGNPYINYSKKTSPAPKNFGLKKLFDIAKYSYFNKIVFLVLYFNI